MRVVVFAAWAAVMVAARYRVIIQVSGHLSRTRHLGQFANLTNYVIEPLRSDNDTDVVGVILCLNSIGEEIFHNSSTTLDLDPRVVLHTSDAFHEEWQRLDDCFRACDSARVERGWGDATHYVHMRPDLIFTRRISPISELTFFI